MPLSRDQKRQGQFCATYSAAISNLRNLSDVKHISQERLRQVALDLTIVAFGIRSDINNCDPTGYLFDAFAIRDKRTTLRRVLEEYLARLRKVVERFMDVVLVCEPHSEQLFFVNARELRERALRTSLDIVSTDSNPSGDDVLYVRLEGSHAELFPPPAQLEPLLVQIAEAFALNPAQVALSLPEGLDIGIMVAFAAYILDFPVAYVPTSGSDTAYLAGVPLDVYECVLETDSATTDMTRRHTMIKFSCPQHISLTTRELSPEDVPPSPPLPHDTGEPDRERQTQDLKMVRYAAAALATNPEKKTDASSGAFAASRARGEYLRTHFKNMREVAAALTGLKLTKAYAYLSDVKDHKQIIPFRRFSGGVGRASQAKQFKATQGRWPEKSVKFITRLLKNAESNADAKNIDVEDLYIKNIVVQQAPKTRRRTYRAHGRINPYQGHPETPPPSGFLRKYATKERADSEPKCDDNAYDALIFAANR
ncbi:hypothetical protein NUW54_g4921 [Trametes sanguinea]|uniref:Uncharacterized protein n=1 Tax=Trametes sanguinea TaxID=158606 RepID=A0ACC1PY75_9APHY|nr:hypothetical protein NUW54_g4921 [Trametes sanguinea]